MRLSGGFFSDPRRLGLFAAAAAVGLGLCYLATAGAPSRLMAMNFAALLVGLAAYATVSLPRWRVSPGLILPALGAVLVATAVFGTPVEGASRWASIGPLNLQPSLILLPVMLVHFARDPRISGAAGLSIAALALALQPDRGMAGVLAFAVAALALRRRDPAVLIALGAAAVAFAATLARPDQLPAVPFVDQILYSSFSLHPLAGVAVVGGAFLLLLPSLAGRRDVPAIVFGACWATIVLAAALGNYPTPLVGYGGSAIVGYLLSVALLPAHASRAAAASDSAPRQPEEQDAGMLSAALARIRA